MPANTNMPKPKRATANFLWPETGGAFTEIPYGTPCPVMSKVARFVRMIRRSSRPGHGAMIFRDLASSLAGPVAVVAGTSLRPYSFALAVQTLRLLMVILTGLRTARSNGRIA